MEVSSQLHVPAALLSEKRAPGTNRIKGCAQSGVDKTKICCPYRKSNAVSSVVQPQVSNIYIYINSFRDSTVGIATGWMAKVSEFVSRQGPRRQDRFWGPPSLPFEGTAAFSPGVKVPRSVADHCLPTSSKGKNMWTYISTPPYVFMA